MAYTLTDVPGVGPSTAELLIANNIKTVGKLAGTDIEELTAIPGIGKVTGLNMIKGAQGLLGENKPAKRAKGKGGRGKAKKDKGKKGKQKKGKDKKRKGGKGRKNKK